MIFFIWARIVEKTGHRKVSQNNHFSQDKLCDIGSYTVRIYCSVVYSSIFNSNSVTVWLIELFN